MTVLLVAGCEEHEFDLGGNNFFPLQIGNYWEFHAPVQNPQGDNTILKMEITTTKEFGGEEYYLMVRKTEGSYGSYVDTLYYMMNDNGYVYQRLKTGELTNPYRLGAMHGSRWRSSLSATSDDISVMYIKNPVVIHSSLVENCREFKYDVEDIIDEEHWTTLAPGIGIVTMHSAWGFKKDLKKAIVNGVEYNF